MKQLFFSPLCALLLLPTFLSAQQVNETPVTIGLVEGGNPQGYLKGANEQGLIFATASGGQGQLIEYGKIRGEGINKLVRFEERGEVLGTARTLYTQGDYAEAAEAFGAVAKDYEFIAAAPHNFASEALFYQLESLKRAGLYTAMAPLAESPMAATIGTKLADAYKSSFELQKLWAIFGKNDMPALKSALEVYQEPQTGDAKMLRTPTFVKMSPTKLSQIAFLRAKVYDSEGSKPLALEDYYRSFTLAYGNDILLAKLAMGAAMVIQKDDPQLAQENKAALTQMQSIAYLYSVRFGKDSMPEAFQSYAVKPDVPRVRMQVTEEPQPEADAPMEAEKATPEDAAKPEDAKKADKKPAAKKKK